MCGRYQLLHLSRLAERFGLNQYALDRLDLAPATNISPTQRVPVILADHVVAMLHWGLIPPSALDMRSAIVNARAEAISEKKMFRRAFRSQRCLLPASGFYEWQTSTHTKAKTPYLYTLADDELFAFAGIWEVWHARPSGQEFRTCAIVTTTPNELVAQVHDRMPAILHPEDEAEWLNPQDGDVGRLAGFLRPYPAEAMHTIPANLADLRR
jgi:putative SOS response-associated peptidase YedK